MARPFPACNITNNQASQNDQRRYVPNDLPCSDPGTTAALSPLQDGHTNNTASRMAAKPWISVENAAVGVGINAAPGISVRGNIR